MLSFRRLYAHEPDDVRSLQAVMRSAPSYSQLVRGRPPLADDTAELFYDLPPGLTAKNKLVGGFWQGEEMIGCLDLCRGYPRAEIAYIGLLLFGEDYQGRGFGRDALEYIGTRAATWGCRLLRLAVMDINTSALRFWRRQGFVEHHRGRVSGHLGEAIVMQRPVRLQADQGSKHRGDAPNYFEKGGSR